LTDRGVAKFGTKVGIEMNNTKYSSNQPWLLELCEPDDVGVYVPNITLPQLKNSHGKTHYDSENAFIFYKSTKNLNLYEAADVRLWSSLAHFTSWEYMKSRWPIYGNKNFILSTKWSKMNRNPIFLARPKSRVCFAYFTFRDIPFSLYVCLT
jgi:hypothetical protein